MRRILFIVSMLVTLSLRAFDATIPVLHLPDYYDAKSKPLFMQKLEKAMHEVGFFALTGANIDPEVLDRAYAKGEEFFELESEYKDRYHLLNGQRGYTAGESAKGSKLMDFKEFFNVGRDYSAEVNAKRGYQAFQTNVWPEHPQDFQKEMIAMREELDKCTNVLDEMFSELLGQKKSFLHQFTYEGDVLLRMNYYPANPPEGAFWGSAHTDINLYTILPRSTAKGLQVFNSEMKWIDVAVPDGAVIINVADQLESMSNGYFKSSWHRVTDPESKAARMSVVHFVHAAPDNNIGPLDNMIEKTGGIRKYAYLTQWELLMERLIDLRLINTKEQMQKFVDSGAIEKLKEVDRFSPKAEAALKEKGLI